MLLRQREMARKIHGRMSGSRERVDERALEPKPDICFRETDTMQIRVWLPVPESSAVVLVVPRARSVVVTCTAALWPGVCLDLRCVPAPSLLPGLCLSGVAKARPGEADFGDGSIRTTVDSLSWNGAHYGVWCPVGNCG